METGKLVIKSIDRFFVNEYKLEETADHYITYGRKFESHIYVRIIYITLNIMLKDNLVVLLCNQFYGFIDFKIAG